MDSITKSILLIDQVVKQIQILAENAEQPLKDALSKSITLLRGIRIILRQESLRRISSGKNGLSAEAKAGIFVVISEIVELAEIVFG